MINNVTTFGKPGATKKYQQPAGTSLFRWTWTNNVSGMTGGNTLLLRQDQFGNTRAIIKTITTPGAGFYTPENTLVLVESMEARVASRAWSGEGASPSLELRANDAGKGFSGDLLKNEPVAETIAGDCNDPDVYSISQGKRLWQHNGSYDFGPEFYIRNYFKDRPTSSVSCVSEFTISALILLPTDGIASLPVQNGTLTLIKEA